MGKRICKSRRLIAKPGTYKLIVTSVGYVEDRTIINLNGITKYHQTQINDAGKAGDWDLATKQHMSVSLFENAGFVPEKGNTVLADVDYAENKEGILCLFVQRISPAPVDSTAKATFSWDEVSEEIAEEPAKKVKEPTIKVGE